jgi:hypothetical protein
MNEKNESLPAPGLHTLERWLGRREALGMVAGRCSAAEAQCLREIRNKNLFLESAANWDEFCRVHLHCSRKKADTVLRQLDEHGPQFFHVTQALHLSEPEYVALKEHFTEAGLAAEGEIIAWLPENTERIAQAIEKLRIAAPKAAKKTVTVETLLARLDAVNAQLEKSPEPLDDGQRRALGEGLLRLSNVAKARGVVLVQR